MAVKFAPSQKTILICDYSQGGFLPPEMVKRRPAVVLVGRLPRRDNLVTVVPLSGTESDERNEYHCKIKLERPLPEPFAETVWWVKADMVATVGFRRLQLFQTSPDRNGNRKYITQLKVSDENFALVRQTVRRALSLD